MTTQAIHVGIVGAGPRGTVALERLCANAHELAAEVPIEVHVIDPETVGAGRVWRTNQNRLLLMNTVASDVTVFTDPTVQCEGPLIPGPTQYEWARLVAAGEITASAEIRAEAAQMLPWSYATRAFQGEYLHWAFEHIAATAPPTVRVHRYKGRAVALDDRPDRRHDLWVDRCAGPIIVDSLILAVGHYEVAMSPAQRRLADFAQQHGLSYVPPASPAEADLSGIAPGQLVAMRGLGLNFYDYITLLTLGRGGRFEDAGDRLVYRPSRAEPRIVAGSGRGIPYLARAEIRQAVVPRYQPRFLDMREITRLRLQAGTGTLDFKTEVWPLVAKEAGWVYYRALLRLRGDAGTLVDFEARYAPLLWNSPEMKDLIQEICPDPAQRWDWGRVDHPAHGRHFSSRAEYDGWIAERLDADYTDSQLGPEGCARKALASIMRDLRDEIRQVISFQGLSGTSYRRDIDGWFSGLNNFVASGPPSSRIRELAALLAAGIISFAGPSMRVETDPERGRFVISSPVVGGEPAEADALIEAYLPPSDLRLATDPLLVHLRQAGRCRPHVIPDANGTGYETGGLDIEEGTMRIIKETGEPNPSLYSYGPPVEAVQWVTAIGARPHVNSRTLLQADAIARAVLRAGCGERSYHPNLISA